PLCPSHAARVFSLLYFFNTPPPPHSYTLSLHDALPILRRPSTKRVSNRRDTRSNHGRSRFQAARQTRPAARWRITMARHARTAGDRKSTRLNSSHVEISYAVFCLKKKKKENKITERNTT